MTHDAHVLYLGIGAPLTFVILCTIVAIVASRAAETDQRRTSFIRQWWDARQMHRRKIRRLKRIARLRARREEQLNASKAVSQTTVFPPPPVYAMAKAHRVLTRRKGRLVIVSDYADGTSAAKLRTKKGRYKVLGSSVTGPAADRAFLEAAGF